MEGPRGPAHEPTLIVAATEGWTWLVREYLEAGADPDSRDSHHTTALMYACYDRADTALASLLCAAGGGAVNKTTCPFSLQGLRPSHRWHCVPVGVPAECARGDGGGAGGAARAELSEATSPPHPRCGPSAPSLLRPCPHPGTEAHQQWDVLPVGPDSLC